MHAKKVRLVIPATVIMMVLFALIQWCYALPLGRVGVITIGPAIGLGALIGMGLKRGLMTLLLGAVIMAALGAGDPVNYGAMLIAMLVPVARLAGRPQPVKLTQNQTHVIGFTTGLLFYAAILGLTVLEGYLVGHTGVVALAFGKQVLAPGLLDGIITGFLAGEMAIRIQEMPLSMRNQPADDPDVDYRDGVRKSVIIDLHDPKKKDRERHDHQDKQD